MCRPHPMLDDDFFDLVGEAQLQSRKADVDQNHRDVPVSR